MNFLRGLLKFQNPKTTWGGILLIGASIVSALGKLVAGQLPEMADATLLIAGINAIVAKDGGK